jgi:hypothetical protein
MWRVEIVSDGGLYFATLSDLSRLQPLLDRFNKVDSVKLRPAT